MARYTKGKPPATPATPATTTTTTTPGIKPTDPVRPDPIVEEEEGAVETYGGGTRTIVKDKVVNTSVHQFPTILNDGVPSKGNPYILKQGLDETKVNFGISCTTFTSPSNVSVTGPAYFKPNKRPETFQGQLRSPYYVNFSGTISRASGSKTVASISTDLNNVILSNAVSSINKGTVVSVRDLTVTGVGDANIVVSVNFYVDAFGDPDIELTPIVLDLDNIVTLS